ncbi:MAG: 2-oxo acid dehydrogenase subunit E2 [Flavobacteriales bacterium]|nr:2-oxo acid dehydrogenase subunit E2 [Flavobacteriales bacterium]
MAQTELILPKMGESVAEATIIKWLVGEGDAVEIDQSIVEIATDKVDSEIPAPLSGVLLKVLCAEGETVAVGTAIAIIGEAGEQPNIPTNGTADLVVAAAPIPEPVVAAATPVSTPAPAHVPAPVAQPEIATAAITDPISAGSSDTPRFHKGRFFSPLVRKIAEEERVTIEELERLSGKGQNGRVTKSDILSYIQTRVVLRTGAPVTAAPPVATAPVTAPPPVAAPAVAPPVAAPPISVPPIAAPSASAPPKPVASSIPQPEISRTSGADEIIEMDRMRKLIADHMVMSKHTSPHVTSFVEADVSAMVQWRNSVKDAFFAREGEKITFTPIFVEAVARAIRDFPMINVTVDGTNIVVKKNINIGMAVALPSGNLIVPVIKSADRMNLYGISKAVNDMANRARINKLGPDDIQGGTFTLTNVGSFGNVMGTPIINQPQVAILATGIIQKKPVVLETPDGDTIGVRHMIFLSLSYDHRVVDGALGGRFVRKVADYLEQFDVSREI